MGLRVSVFISSMISILVDAMLLVGNEQVFLCIVFYTIDSSIDLCCLECKVDDVKMLQKHVFVAGKVRTANTMADFQLD